MGVYYSVVYPHVGARAYLRVKNVTTSILSLAMKLKLRPQTIQRPFKYSRKPFAHVASFGAIFLIAVFAINHDFVRSSVRSLRDQIDPVKPPQFASPTAKTVTEDIVDNLGIKGGIVYRIPSTWNRLNTPWLKRPSVHLKTPEQSNHRYLYSPTRMMTSDGIGHSMGVVNYEYNIAYALNITYTHRVGLYSSLSSKDRYAVEKFFGWGRNQVPRALIQKEGCNPANGSWPRVEQIYKCHVCESPKKTGAMKIERIVQLPSEIGIGCRHPLRLCQDANRRFLSKNSRHHTIFQVSQKHCNPPETYSNFLVTKDLFYGNYWTSHARMPWSQNDVPPKSYRAIRLKPRELNVAIHVRRGDFLKPENKGKRQITKDTTFANILLNALSHITEVGGPFAQMPVTVHIYSEGNLRRKSVPSTHSIDAQDKVYYDSTGKPRDEKWWRALILEKAEENNAALFDRLESRFKVKLHISEDTLLSLHEMIAADLFIGSASGLSGNLVWALSRGVVLIPYSGSINNEMGKKGTLCCSVPFENGSGRFSNHLFKKYWKAYAAANEESALRSIAKYEAKQPQASSADR